MGHAQRMLYTFRTKAFLISGALSATVVPYCGRGLITTILNHRRRTNLEIVWDVSRGRLIVESSGAGTRDRAEKWSSRLLVGCAVFLGLLGLVRWRSVIVVIVAHDGGC